MEQSLSWEADSRLASHKFPPFMEPGGSLPYWEEVSRSVLSQMNPLHILIV
jgi:hypothetical protein